MTDSDKHIKKSIKESFDGLERKAPEGLWTNVSQASSLSEDEFIIRESFNNQAKSAPSKTWKNVKKQLIIDEVWDEIVAYEDRRKRKFIWWYIGSASILLFILSLSILTINSGNEVAKLKAEKSSAKQSNQAYQESVIKNENSEFSQIDTESLNHFTNDVINESSEEKRKLSNAGGSTIINNSNNGTNTEYNLIETRLHSNKIDAYEHKNDSGISIDPFDIVGLIVRRIPPKEIQLIEVEPIYPMLSTTIDSIIAPQKKRFEIGLVACYGNSWLFNNDVKNGLNRNSLINDNLSTGYSLGSVIGYNFSKKSGLELGYDFYSVHNQGYDFYNEGRLFHKEIRLKQQKVSLAYKLRFNENAYKKRNLLFKTGLFFSHSIKEQTTINWVENTANSSFSAFDYGLNLGAGIEYDFSKFKVEYGVKTDIGLHNLTANSIKFPKKFDYATTYILGGYISIRYLF